MKTPSQDNRSLGRESNPGSPEYEAGVPTVIPQLLVWISVNRNEIRTTLFSAVRYISHNNLS
jgi:hypothetical protein